MDNQEQQPDNQVIDDLQSVDLGEAELDQEQPGHEEKLNPFNNIPMSQLGGSMFRGGSIFFGKRVASVHGKEIGALCIAEPDEAEAFGDAFELWVQSVMDKKELSPGWNLVLVSLALSLPRAFIVRQSISHVKAEQQQQQNKKGEPDAD